MPFFDRRRGPDPTPVFGDRPRVPSWWDEPDALLGVVVTTQLVLARTDTLAVTVREIVAYPTGFSLTVRIVARQGHSLPEVGADPGLRNRHTDSPQSGFRFGLLHADGTKLEAAWHARYFGGDLRHPPDFDHLSGLDQPPQPFIAPSGGSGGSALHWYGGYWSAPLPPPGPLGFVTQWLDGDVPETTVTTEAGAILEAAEASRSIWDL